MDTVAGDKLPWTDNTDKQLSHGVLMLIVGMWYCIID